VVTSLVVGASPALADSGLSGMWHLNEGYGTLTADSSTNFDTGTLSRGAQWVYGRYGKGLLFNGADSKVSMPSNAALQPANALTVTAWVAGDHDVLGNYKYIVSKGGSGCDTGSYGLYTGPSGGLMLTVTPVGANSGTTSPDAGSGVWHGPWHFVAGTYDGSMVRLYVDGHQIGTGTPLTGAIRYGLPNTALVIGNYVGCSGLGFVGAIDEPTVWSRALSPSEIVTLMNCPSYGSPLAICATINL
jgi:hypothetical protein